MEAEFTSLHAALDEMKESMTTRIKQERASRTYELQVAADLFAYEVPGSLSKLVSAFARNHVVRGKGNYVAELKRDVLNFTPHSSPSPSGSVGDKAKSTLNP